MADITNEQFIAAFNGAFASDADALNAVAGLGHQWRVLKAQAQAQAVRASAQATSQAAEASAQAADAAEQQAKADFVAFVAGLGS